MTKIAFIGAGSLGFTRGLVRDILTFPLLQDATTGADGHRPGAAGLRPAGGAAHRRHGQLPGQGRGDAGPRARRSKGADAVLVTILAGGVDVWRHDIEIPKKYGVDINVGDTRGPSGIFRALRTIPVMLDIARDMERYCPDAILLNYTNPMAMLCRAMQRETQHPGHRPVPQRAGHGRDAGQVDRRADERDHLRLRRHQPPGLVPQVRVEGQGRLPADPQGRSPSGPKIYNEEQRAQRDVPGTSTTTSPSPAATTRSTTGGSASART